MSIPKMAAREVLAALYRHFGDRWAMLTEVTARSERLTTAQWQAHWRGAITEEELRANLHPPRRIDALLLRPSRTTAPAGRTPDPLPAGASPLFDLAPAPADPAPALLDEAGDGGIERLAVEVKVTRADFLQDVRNPDKQQPWRDLAHRHVYAVPAGLVTASEVPTDSGLIYVTPREGSRPTVEFARRAPRLPGHNPGPLPLANIMDAYWRASRAEARAKGLIGTYGLNDIESDPEALRLTVKRLQHDLDLAHNRAERERENAVRWRKRYAAHEPPPCGTCGQPLHPARRRGDYGWDHRDQAVASACQTLREREVDGSRAGEADGARWAYVPGPEPVDSLSPEGTS